MSKLETKYLLTSTGISKKKKKKIAYFILYVHAYKI